MRYIFFILQIEEADSEIFLILSTVVKWAWMKDPAALLLLSAVVMGLTFALPDHKLWGDRIKIYYFFK